MPKKCFGAEQIILKLQEAQVDLAKGLKVVQVRSGRAELVNRDARTV